ncbi:hypothetical protein ITP53_06500 [Nonomuraea sp. K274]|uniref:Uncharacterized protein n=1 Tax=Nonomuraea cypriaca TaxID=1187855 RepID=A0A931EXD7_9ACTN|nr:hypothetical protein [Nonomuraea cypriaca]MBF8185392.1 hypothetical protein [Nonomuraea cypriaca]
MDDELAQVVTPALLRELDEQVERVGEVLEGRPRLTIGPVPVGALTRLPIAP